MRQLALSFEPGMSTAHRSLREFAATRIYQRGLVAVAGKLDVSPSHLTEKLAGKSSDGKERCLTVDELEEYIDRYQDLTPIFYLIDKFLGDPELARAQAIDKIARFVDQLPGLLNAAGIAKGRR